MPTRAGGTASSVPRWRAGRRGPPPVRRAARGSSGPAGAHGTVPGTCHWELGFLQLFSVYQHFPASIDILLYTSIYIAFSTSLPEFTQAIWESVINTNLYDGKILLNS